MRSIKVYYNKEERTVVIKDNILVVPSWAEEVYCAGKKLRSIRMTKNVKWLSCINNPIKNLEYYEGTKVYCDDEVKKTILPSSKGVK